MRGHATRRSEADEEQTGQPGSTTEQDPRSVHTAKDDSTRQDYAQKELEAPPTVEAPSTPDAAWTVPPTEELVSKFPSDADSIEPPPAPEPVDTVAFPTSPPAPSVSPEAAARKRAPADPFLSPPQPANLAAAPVGGAPAHPREAATPRRRRKRWIAIIAIAAVLVVLLVLACPALSALLRKAPVQQASALPLATISSGPSPTPINLAHLTPLLSEPAPGCGLQDRDFWSFVAINKSCATDGLHLTNQEQIPVVAELQSINSAALKPDLLVVSRVSLVSGQQSDEIGVVTRFSAQGGYFFSVNAAGGWQITSWEQPGDQTYLIRSGRSAVIHRGLQTANTLEVLSEGSAFTFSVNQTWITSIHDTTFESGQVGLGLRDTGSQAAFSNFAVYNVPAGAAGG